jgi:hypothetical protein
MSKGRNQRKRQVTQSLTHVIQSRITVVNDKHVCQYCGVNACFLDVGYEVITQSLIDQARQEFRQCTTLDEVWKTAITSPTGDAIYYATLREQQKQGPREHNRAYRCFSCLGGLLSRATGTPYSGEAMLSRLLSSPLCQAVFAVRSIETPDTLNLMGAPFQDVAQALNALRREADIPRMELTLISPG